MPFIIFGVFSVTCILVGIHAYRQRAVDLTEEQQRAMLVTLETKIRYTQLRKERAIREGNARLLTSMSAAEKALTEEYHHMMHEVS